MEQQINIIKDIGFLFFPNSIIFLFGSRARLDFTEDSDFDLLIITKEEYNMEQKREFKAKIRRLLALKKIPIDILIYSNNEFEIKKEITGHIVKQAFKEGIKL